MEMADILARIDAHRLPMGISDSHLSEAAGSRDLIRNWRRAVAEGRSVSARHDKLEQVARAMGITLADLLGQSIATAPPRAQPTARAPGFADSATPFTLRPHAPAPDAPLPQISALFGPSITSPATFRLGCDLPGFALSRGDILVVDLARLPNPGELAIVTLLDDATATATNLPRRYLPPFLLAGETNSGADMLRVDNPNVTVRYPVVASIRGIAPD